MLPMTSGNGGATELKFRDPSYARALSSTLARLVDEIGRAPVSIMHVCGSHEQAIARFGLRAALPRALDVIMGPGCPVCITDVPEVDEGVALARQGVRIATYGDMVKVPGSVMSLADAQAEGARIDVVYSVAQAVELARAQRPSRWCSSPPGLRRPRSQRRPPCCRTRLPTSSYSRRTNTSRRSWRSSRRCPTRASKDFLPPAMRRRSPAGASSNRSSSATSSRWSSRASSRWTSSRAWRSSSN